MKMKFILLLLLIFLCYANSLRVIKNINRNKVPLYHAHNLDDPLNSPTIKSEQKYLGKFISSVLKMSIITLSLNLHPSVAQLSESAKEASKTTVAAKINPLEEAIVKLENSEGRSGAVQALADVFEASGSKTLLARSKYKYVRKSSIFSFLFFFLFNVKYLQQ
jgi:hypothetical protein